jgi:hypothetical protein
MMFRPVACAALIVASCAGCAGRPSLSSALGSDAGAASLPNAADDAMASNVPSPDAAASPPATTAADAAVVSDAALEAFEGLSSMIGVVACPGEIPGGFSFIFDVTSCWTPTDSPSQVQTFCHPLNEPGGSWLRVLVQRPHLVVTNAPLPVGNSADATIVVEVDDNPTGRHAILEATSGTAILDHYQPDPTSPHFGGRLLDIQMTPLPPTGAICRMPTTSFYSR